MIIILILPYCNVSILNCLRIIEYLERPFPVHSRLCGWSYLIYFLIGKLSYSPSSEPSHTVLLLDVMYTTDPHLRSKSYSPPWAAPFNLFLHDFLCQTEAEIQNIWDSADLAVTHVSFWNAPLSVRIYSRIQYVMSLYATIQALSRHALVLRCWNEN